MNLCTIINRFRQPNTAVDEKNAKRAEALEWVLEEAVDIACTNWDNQTPDVFDDLILLCDLTISLGGDAAKMDRFKEVAKTYRAMLTEDGEG